MLTLKISKMEVPNLFIWSILLLAVSFPWLFLLQQQNQTTPFTVEMDATIDDKHKSKSLQNEPIFYPAPKQNVQLVNTDKLLFNLPRLDFAIVTDLDKSSRDSQKFLWGSYFKRGSLIRKQSDNIMFEIEWHNHTVLESKFAYRNRSMELSELVRYDHLLLAMCDITGLVYKIRHRDGSIFQRWALADGDGEKAKPFKGEWATVKDGMLWLGSTGKEWTTEGGQIEHRNPEWVKSIDRNGRIENYDWGPVYQAIRTATNTSAPGYIWHEAVHFDQLHRRWIFLPRKESIDMYHPDLDEYKGTNLLITTAEDFTDMKITRLGPKEKEYGFSSIRKIPGTNDLYVALKVREVKGETSTKLTVFDLNGKFYIDPPFVEVSNNMKFEGKV